MKADEVLDKLVFFGCSESEKMKHVGRWVYFEPLKYKPTRKDHISYLCRWIRAAVLLERSGELIADIDRMGRVIGWHKSRNVKKETEK